MVNDTTNPFQEGTPAATATAPVQVADTPKEEAPKAQKPKKIFSLKDVVRSVTCPVHLPKLYPDFEPWVFKLRIKLSKEAEDRRQEYFTLSQMEQTVKAPEQALDEICDLLEELPTGFGDLQDLGNGPGASYRSYVEHSGEAKDQLLKITEGASNLYWNYTSPREFRGEVSGSV